MAEFLTTAWFDEVERLTKEAGELNLTPAHRDAEVNVSVDDNGTLICFAFCAGELRRAALEEAKTSVRTTKDVATKIFFDRDVATALEAFMTGQIAIDGDLSQLMLVQASPASQEQIELFERIHQMSQRPN